MTGRPNRAPMVLRWTRAVRGTKLSHGARDLALVLLTYANADGTRCFPGDENLCADLGDVTRQSVGRYRKELLDAGLLMKERPASGPGTGGGAVRATEWRLIIPAKDGTSRFPVSQKDGTPRFPVSENREPPGSKQGTVGFPHLPRTSPKETLSPHARLLDGRLPDDATAEERETIIRRIQPRVKVSLPAYLERMPDEHLRYMLDELRQAAPSQERQDKPPWCGTCNERTRIMEPDTGRPFRCPDCHPARTEAGAAS
jgi:hypothetical protein